MSDYLWPRARYLVCKDDHIYKGVRSKRGYKCGKCLRGIVGEVYVERDCRVCKARRIRG